MQSGRWLPNKLHVLLLLAAGLMPSVATSQTTLAAHDARSSAMGGCFMPDTSGRCLRVAWRGQYLLPGLADRHLAVALPAGRTGLATMGYTHHGNADYHRQQASAGYTLRAAAWLRMGAAVGVDFTGTSNPDYETRLHAAAEAYACATVADGLTLTLLAGSHPEQLRPRRRLAAQAAYTAARLTTVAEAELTDRVRARIGMEYNYRETLFVRAGLSTAPLTVGGGLGFGLGRYSLDIGIEEHPVLGLSPHLALTLCF